MRTIIYVLIGLVMWIVSFIKQEQIITATVTMALTTLNSLLLEMLFHKGGETKFPLPFVASTYWLIMSTLPILHHFWQAQLLILEVLVVLLLTTKIEYQKEATEEVFLSTLIFCFLSPFRIALIIGIIMLWGYLIAKGHMSWRVWAASLIAIALRVIIMIVLHYFGWLKWYWTGNTPNIPWQQWVIFFSIFIGTILIIILPVRKHSIISGVIYIASVLTTLTCGVLLMYTTI